MSDASLVLCYYKSVCWLLSPLLLTLGSVHWRIMIHIIPGGLSPARKVPLNKRRSAVRSQVGP